MRHEEAAVHAADGYFRASGNMAMVICTSEPGATNFVTGLYTAQIDSIPLVALLIIGMFIECSASMIILTTLIVPTAIKLGIDPIHFGLVMVLNLCIGGITPPFGTTMFVVCSMLKINIVDYIKEALPMIFAIIIVLVFVSCFPSIILFLPNLIFGP